MSHQSMMETQTEGLPVFGVLTDKWNNLDATYCLWYFWKSRAGKDCL